MKDVKQRATSKDTLEYVTKELIGCSDCVFIVGYALLLVVVWPVQGCLQEYLDTFRAKLLEYHIRSTVYIIFDR